MKNTHFKNFTIVIGTLMLIGLASIAIAGMGMGGHHGDSDGYGYGYHNGGGHHGMYGDDDTAMTGPEAEKIKAEREAFYNATKKLKQDVREKRAALKLELVKETPNKEKAGAIQADISELKAQIAQKRIDHLITMRKINPDAGYGNHMMDGRHGRGMGQHGKRNCW